MKKKLIGLSVIGALALSCSAWADSVQESDIPGICATATNDACNDYVLQTEKDVQKNDGAGDPGYYVPYTDSLAPTLAIRAQGIEAQKQNIERDQSLPAGSVDKMFQQILAEKTGTYPNELKSQFTQVFHKHYQGATRKEDIELKDFGAIVGCKAHAECLLAFRQVVTEAQYGSIDASALLLGDLFVDVLTDPSYLKPLARLEHLLTQKVRLAQLSQNNARLDTSGGTSGNDLGDIFSDIKKSFLADGISASEAEEKTWKILALYSVRGPAFDNFYPLMLKENLPVVASIGIMASALTYLDKNALAHGLPLYSYPRSVRSRCDTTRPYHFWMAAYLAHQLKKTSAFSNEAIVSAVHGLEFIYEVAGAVATKQGYDAVVNARKSGSTLFSAYRRETQKSILFNDAGALYGVQGEVVAQDVDQRFADMINQAPPLDDALDSLVTHLSTDVANVFIIATNLGKNLADYDVDPIHTMGWTAILNPEISLDDTLADIQ